MQIVESRKINRKVAAIHQGSCLDRNSYEKNKPKCISATAQSLEAAQWLDMNVTVPTNVLNCGEHLYILLSWFGCRPY